MVALACSCGQRNSEDVRENPQPHTQMHRGYINMYAYTAVLQFLSEGNVSETELMTFKSFIKQKLVSLKTSPQTRYLHMHGGRVDFSHTDEDLSGLSSPPRRRRKCTVCQGWIKGKKEWVMETWLDLCEEMGHGLRKQGISFAQGSWDPLSSLGLGNIYNMCLRVCVCLL